MSALYHEHRAPAVSLNVARPSDGKRHEPAQASRPVGNAAAPAIVLYDGSCGLCTGTMSRGQRCQRPGAIEWVDNGSSEGQALLREHGLLGKEKDSLIVIEGDRVSIESAAIVRSSLRLRWPWKASSALWIVPKPLRDAVYRRVSASRARHAACRLPAPTPAEATDPTETTEP